MDAVKVPMALFEKFSWDARQRGYVAFIPMNRPGWPAGIPAQKMMRFRVEFRHEGYAVLIPPDSD